MRLAFYSAIFLLLFIPGTIHAPAASNVELVVKKPEAIKVRVEVTAYSVGDGLTPSDTMANGEKVHEGAVAYNDVPLGTKVVIDGKTYTVKDRMADNGVVDIYMNTVEAAIKHGRKVKVIEILWKE